MKNDKKNEPASNLNSTTSPFKTDTPPIVPKQPIITSIGNKKSSPIVLKTIIFVLLLLLLFISFNFMTQTFELNQVKNNFNDLIQTKTQQDLKNTTIQSDSYKAQIDLYKQLIDCKK